MSSHSVRNRKVLAMERGPRHRRSRQGGAADDHPSLATTITDNLARAIHVR
jgi:hypothetical protein